MKWHEASRRLKQAINATITFLKWLVFITPIKKIPIPKRETVKESLSKQSNHDAIDLYYHEVTSKLDYDLECSDGLDNKASIFAGVVGTLLAILAAITIKNPGDWFKTLSIIAIGFFVLAIIFAIASYRPRDFEKSPEPFALITKSCDEQVDAIRRDLICNWVADFACNKQILLRKKYYLQHSAVFVVIGILFLAISVAIKIAIS